MRQRVLILGAGFAGHTAALHLSTKLKGQHDVTVVAPGNRFMWFPSLIWVGTGAFPAEKCWFELAPVYERLGWWGTLIFVAIAYFHHLYMDFVQLRALQYVGEAASYLAALPVAVVTVFGSMLLVYRSNMRWTMGSMFLFAGLIGWIVGGIGAVLDATIPFNVDLHNTLWVPAHFHTYLLEGVLLFIIGWVFMVLEEASASVTPAIVRWLTGIGAFGGGAVFLLGFYVAGAAGVPRRYAVQPAPGPEIASWATMGALLVLLGMMVAVIEAVRLARAARTA